MDTVSEFFKVKEALGSSETADEALSAFKKMEKSGTFNERDLGLASVFVGFKLHAQGKNPQKALAFATRALKALDTDDKEPSFPVANALFLMGTIHHGLNKFRDSLGYLKRGYSIMGRLKDEGVDVESVWSVFHGLELLLAQVYVGLFDYKEALPFCLKVLETDEKREGPNSVAVACHRQLLEDIYNGLGEHGKALEQHVLAQRVMKNKSVDFDPVEVDFDAANTMIAMGMYRQAVKALKKAVKLTKKDSYTQGIAHLFLANALRNQGKFKDCKKHLEISRRILAKEEQMSPLEVADAYSQIWENYVTMKEIETAISLLKRTLALLEKLPQEETRQAAISERLGTLLVQTDKVQQAIPYFESAVENLKYILGPNDVKVGAMYNKLGVVYFKLDRNEKAAEMFEVAKDIMVASLGPHHEMTIETCEKLSKAYDAIGRDMHHAAQHAMQPMMGKVSGEVESRHPSVKWAQRSDELYITVELPDAQDVKVKLEPEGKFYFTATAGEEKIPYEVNIDLFDKVDVNNSKACVGSRNIFYLVKKAESKWWDRMLKQGGKSPVFLKVDWEKWVDEDEEEEADKSGFDMDFGDIFCSKLNMGGGEGLGDNNDDHNKSEVTGEASAYNAPDSKGHGGQHS